MKAIKLFILPLLFSFCAVQVFFLGMRHDKEVQSFRADFACEISKHELLQGFEFDAETLVSINNLIKAFLTNAKLDLLTTISTQSKTILASSHLQTVEQKQDFLTEDNYKSLMQFLTDLSSLPYPLRYTKFCFGVECPGGVEIGVTVK